MQKRLPGSIKDGILLDIVACLKIPMWIVIDNDLIVIIEAGKGTT